MSSISPSPLRSGSTDTIYCPALCDFNMLGLVPPCHDEQRSILTSHQGVQHNTWKWLIPPLYQFLQSLYFSLALNLIKNNWFSSSDNCCCFYLMKTFEFIQISFRGESPQSASPVLPVVTINWSQVIFVFLSVQPWMLMTIKTKSNILHVKS